MAGGRRTCDRAQESEVSVYHYPGQLPDILPECGRVACLSPFIC